MPTKISSLESEGQRFFSSRSFMAAMDMIRPAPISIELGKAVRSEKVPESKEPLNFGAYERNGRGHPLLIDPFLNMKRMTIVYLLDDEDRVLLIHRSKNSKFAPNTYQGIGGKFNRGENFIDCLARETKEESGYNLHKAEYVGVFTSTYRDSDELHMVYVYRSFWFDGQQDSSDEGKLGWFARSNLPRAHMLPSTPLYCDLAMDGKPFMAHFDYESIKKLNLAGHELMEVSRDRLVY